METKNKETGTNSLRAGEYSKPKDIDECVVCAGIVTEEDVSAFGLQEGEHLCDLHKVRCFSDEYTLPIWELME